MRTTLLTTLMFLASTAVGFSSPENLKAGESEKNLHEINHHEKKDKDHGKHHGKDHKDHGKHHGKDHGNDHKDHGKHHGKDHGKDHDKKPEAKKTQHENAEFNDSKIKKASSILDTDSNFKGEFGRNS